RRPVLAHHGDDRLGRQRDLLGGDPRHPARDLEARPVARHQGGADHRPDQRVHVHRAEHGDRADRRQLRRRARPDHPVVRRARRPDRDPDAAGHAARLQALRPGGCDRLVGRRPRGVRVHPLRDRRLVARRGPGHRHPGGRPGRLLDHRVRGHRARRTVAQRPVRRAGRRDRPGRAGHRAGPVSYRDHLVDDVLAWWAANGHDHAHGGVLTCWDNAGTRLVSDDKYTWSQGRWAWLTARVALDADLLGVDGGWYADQALRTAEFVRDHAVLPDGTTAFVTNRAGDEAGPHTSVYADLFAALGFAGVARLHPEGEWGGRAEEILLRSAAAIASGEFRSDPYPVPVGHRSFGLPMILVGVGEQVHRATGSAASAALVRDAARQIEEHHLAGDDVAEMPAEIDGLLSRHRTPGHVLEAAWFLHHARDLLTGSALAEPDRLARIAVHALELGWDREHGGLLRYVDRDGGAPTGARTDD